MGEGTKIEWADHTFNPWIGCTKVSPACDHCYAEDWSKRFKGPEWGKERRRTSPANWKKPLKWNRYALAHPNMTPRWVLTYFVIWLRGRKLYSCDCGPSGFFHWFNSGQHLPPTRVHELVCELEAR